MDKTEVALAMGVDKQVYASWEDGDVAVPTRKLKKLAKTIGVTEDAILGKPEPFDLLGIDDSVDDSRTYFGEIAVHFSNNKSILLPVSEAERTRLYDQLSTDSKFIRIDSLDNRIVMIRREAVSDIYISSEACDDYGPELYDDYIGVYPDEGFWAIVEALTYGEELDSYFTEERVNKVIHQIRATGEEIDKLIAENKIEPKDRDTIIKECEEHEKLFTDRAMNVVWQFSSSGKIREQFIEDDNEIYSLIFCIEMIQDNSDEMTHLSVHGYHQSVFINKNDIDYLFVPGHRYHNGIIEEAE